MQILVKIKGKLKGAIFLQALPYALLISVLTILGLFGGYTLGKGFGGSVASFVLALALSLLGFSLGLIISYALVKLKYE